MSAVSYFVNQRLIIGSNVRSTNGVWLHLNPICLRASVKAEEVADELSVALDQSNRIAPHPNQSEWRDLFKPFLKVAGVRSYSAFMNGARSIVIDENEDSITLTPWQNLGPKEGFRELTERALKLPLDTSAGAVALLDMLNMPS